MKFKKIDNNQIQFDDKRKSILFIYQILDELENQIQENNDLRKEKEELINNKSIERRKRHQEEIDSLNKKIDKINDEFKNYKEYNWRKITNTFRRYIIENNGESAYEQLVDEELQDLKDIPRKDNFKRNIKSYHGL
tara:strand:- start:72 stop:479 length:408 start_codon:yes stop_codon:yes gene_type:complete